MDHLLYVLNDIRDLGIKVPDSIAACKRVDSSDLTALKHFAEDYPQAQRYLLYRGDDRLKRDGIICMPCEEFLLALRPDHIPE